MTKTTIARIAKDAASMVRRHSPELLTGVGIAGMITATAFAVKATPKAVKLIEEAKREHDEEFKPVDAVKASWKCYIPTAALTVVSAACLIGASRVNTKRNAALAAAYTLSDTAFREYQEKVVETIGEKKEQTVRESVADEKLAKNPVSHSEVIITNKGNTLCYDTISGRYFRYDMDKIRRAENELNSRIISDIGGWVSLNEFYDELDLPHIDIGDDLGWNVDRRIRLNISARLAEDDTPCVVVGHYVPPTYSYNW